MAQPATGRKRRSDMKRRVIVVPLIHNSDGEYLICRMSEGRGVYPGQWGLPGGGIEADETMEAALRREAHEELGLELDQVKPLLFKDTVHEKLYPDGRSEAIYMIFLIFDCPVSSTVVVLNEEFVGHAWVLASGLGSYDLNEATLDTFRQVGLLEARSPSRTI